MMNATDKRFVTNYFCAILVEIGGNKYKVIADQVQIQLQQFRPGSLSINQQSNDILIVHRQEIVT